MTGAGAEKDVREGVGRKQVGGEGEGRDKGD